MSERGKRDFGFLVVIVGSVVVFFVLVALFVRQQPEDRQQRGTLRLPEEMVVDPPQRAERPPAFCTAERAETAELLITRTGAREIFVEGYMWAALPYDSRVDIARWASECTQDGFRVSIRDAHSGRELANYSSLRGYQYGR